MYSSLKMQKTGVDEYSRLKLAQIWNVFAPSEQSPRNSYSRNCIINEILKDDFNINHKFTINDEIKANFDPRSGFTGTDNSHLKDCTVLHLLHKVHDIDVFKTLIRRGADFTIKNGNGQTAFHVMIIKSSSDVYHQDIPFINSVLSAHVQFQNPSNPHDNHGLSHFHGACMGNHAEAAKLFLDSGASVAETVDLGAPAFAGYTPLHFAAAFGSFRVAKILVERGANVNAQTAEGESPLDLLMGNYFNVFSSHKEMSNKEQFAKMLLDRSAVSAVGLSALQIACSFKDLKMAEELLDKGADIEYAVPKKSTIHPDYTALHFAAENSIEAVKMLLKRGAKIDVTHARNRTALGLCMMKYSLPFEFCKANYTLQDLCSILSCTENLSEIRLSDGQSKLLDLISAMENLDKFKRFLQDEVKDITAVVPDDSVVWPGYSILHLAVAFSRKLESNRSGAQQFGKMIVEECLNLGLKINLANHEGQTPIHLTFSQGQNNIYELMLEHLRRLDQVTNLVDKNNLSYLHIACYMKDEALVDRLLRVSEPKDISRGTTMSVSSIEAGSTPLHVAVTKGSRAIAELLLQRGADLHAIDKKGFTPIHWLVKCSSAFSLDGTVGFLMGLLSANVTDRVVNGIGLSYLHIASYFGYAGVVEKLLDLGSDVNAIIKYDESKVHGPIDTLGINILSRILSYSNFTPLQMVAASRNSNDRVVDVLLRRGADISVIGFNEIAKRSGCVFIDNMRVLRPFFQLLWEREDIQKSMEQRLGLTKLHVACFLKIEQVAEHLLNDGLDVNARVRADSVIFAGCTPLHLLVTIPFAKDTAVTKNLQLTISNTMTMLLDRGADVTIANAKNDTAIHVLIENSKFFVDGILCEDMLLNAHRDFRVNPANAEGLSYFHLACFWHHVDVVEKFLQHGSVNVNQPVDYFAKHIGGCTPLHMALSRSMGPNNDWTKLLQIVDLLLNYGAKVHVKDVYGDTPLHKPAALNSPNMSILQQLVSWGGDVHCENLDGQSPIELLTCCCRMDTNNLRIFKNYGYKINSWNRMTGVGFIGKIFLQGTQPNLSQNPNFKEFLESSSDVRAVDEMGRTAIHNAVAHSENLSAVNRIDAALYKYKYAIHSFMKIGIDIDHQDKSGLTALHYAARMENSTAAAALLACGADINIVDNNGNSALSYAAKGQKINSLFGFLCETNLTVVLRLHVKNCSI